MDTEVIIGITYFVHLIPYYTTSRQEQRQSPQFQP